MSSYFFIDLQRIQYFILYTKKAVNWLILKYLIWEEAVTKVHTQQVGFHLFIQTSKNIFISPYFFMRCTVKLQKNIKERFKYICTLKSTASPFALVLTK